jgi:hypothetical protein
MAASTSNLQAGLSSASKAPGSFRKSSSSTAGFSSSVSNGATKLTMPCGQGLVRKGKGVVQAKVKRKGTDRPFSGRLDQQIAETGR